MTFDFITHAMSAFAKEAELLDVRRGAPRLSAGEKWVLDELESFRSLCPAHRRAQFEAACEWVRAAQLGVRLRSLAQRWRRERWTGPALLEETRLLARRLPLRDEQLGPPRMIACVSGEDGVPEGALARGPRDRDRQGNCP